MNRISFLLGGFCFSSLKQNDMKGLNFYFKSFCFESMCSNNRPEFSLTLGSEKMC